MSGFIEFQSSVLTSSAISTESSPTEPKPTEEPSAVTPTEISDIVLNIKVKYNYEEINEFINELRLPNETMLIGNRRLSVFQLYTLHSLNDPVDMSSLTERTIYRSKLFIRKNDKFSPFNFCFLLNLFDIEYQMNHDEQFPKVWRTTFNTKVKVNVMKFSQMEDGRTSSELNDDKHEARNLLDVFKIICREQKYDEQHAKEWKEKFQGK
jgi:hypothetical protein